LGKLIPPLLHQTTGHHNDGEIKNGEQSPLLPVRGYAPRQAMLPCL